MNDLNTLVDICGSNLLNSEECLQYLCEERGLSKDIIEKYNIGFFPQNASKITEYVSEELLTKLNIIDSPRRSQFSDYFSLVFPIYSEYGDVVGISGRTLMSEDDRRAIGIPKYKNSSYKKANILYGLNESKEHILNSGNAYVVEGYFDHISMYKAGINNSVAICGTAFSQKHFVKLARYTDKITFILDSDEAGRLSAKRIYSKFINRGLKLRFLEAPYPYKDIDEYLNDKTKEDFYKEFRQIIPEQW